MNRLQGTSIVLARPEDAEGIASVARRIWRQSYSHIISRAQIDYMLEQRFSQNQLSADLSGNECQYWIIRRGAEVVGYGSMALTPVEGRLKIQQLYVEASERGGGLGRRLMDQMIELAKTREARVVWLTVNRDNQSAIGFYQQYGFSMAGTCLAEIGQGFVMDDYVMEKSILGAEAGSR